MPEYRNIFPEPPFGKSILDLGCNAGFYLIRARLDGAAFCMGMDRTEGTVAEARRVTVELGLYNILFVVQDVLTYSPPPQEFDIVLCLNLLHHFGEKEIVRILGMADIAAKERMVFIFPPLLEGGPFGRVRTKGTWFTGMTEEFLREYFQNCTIVKRKTAVKPFDRILMDVRKK